MPDEINFDNNKNKLNLKIKILDDINAQGYMTDRAKREMEINW